MPRPASPWQPDVATSSPDIVQFTVLVATGFYDSALRKGAMLLLTGMRALNAGGPNIRTLSAKLHNRTCY